MSSFIQVGLQHAENLPPRVRMELEQIVAALQQWASQQIPIDSIPMDDIEIDASQIVSGILVPARGGTGVNGAAAPAGYLLIGNGAGFTLAPLSAGDNISIVNSAGGILINSQGGHEHGLQRTIADGVATAFDLLDFADSIINVFDNGLLVDPTLYSLSSDRTQVVFLAAPTATHVIVVNYIIADV